MHRPALFALALTIAGYTGVAAGEELPAVTVLSERSPFTQETAQNPDGGEATAFLEQLLDAAGVDFRLEFLPWRRAYRYVLSEPNTLIYPLARSPSREDNFVWVGEIIPVNYYLFKLRDRDDIQVNNLDEARKYRVGVVNYHVHHEYLTSEGFNDLHPVNSNFQNLKKALLGRIDLFPLSDGGLMPICEQNHLDCSQFEPVLKLQAISGGLYYAFSKDSNPEITSRTQQAYRALVESGGHTQVFRKRLQEAESFNKRWPDMAVE